MGATGALRFARHATETVVALVPQTEHRRKAPSSPQLAAARVATHRSRSPFARSEPESESSRRVDAKLEAAAAPWYRPNCADSAECWPGLLRLADSAASGPLRQIDLRDFEYAGRADFSAERKARLASRT